MKTVDRHTRSSHGLVLPDPYRCPLTSAAGHRPAEPGSCSLMGIPVDLGEPISRARETSLSFFDLVEPALALGFGDTSDEVVANVDQSPC
ncbi:hypothetical protein [Streptomyces sp900116325]|uniref:hypothetical protein n=1 Tax=Streptomyces sp. 900116325 TaxID=3154295 RepID=UPI003332EC1D